MRLHRRILKRTRTIERISIVHDRVSEPPERFEGEAFGLGIFNEAGEMIYGCSLTGKISVEELENGEIRIGKAK